jgi:2'-5' RNA ligase
VAKRLFIAVDIDAATRRQVERISSGVRAEIETHTRASWVRADRMHLTLHFFSGADAQLEERVRAALVDPVPEAAFDLSFAGIGLFPERGSPRVVWLGTHDGTNALGRVYGILDHRLSVGTRSGPLEPFRPHLTLARVRERIPRGRLAGIGNIPAFAGPSRIDRVTFYESRLSPAGPSYLPLAEAPLLP